MPIKYPPWHLDKRFPFGQYGPNGNMASDTKGDPLWLVIDTDPGYIDWCIENVDGFELDNEAYERYQKARR